MTQPIVLTGDGGRITHSDLSDLGKCPICGGELNLLFSRLYLDMLGLPTPGTQYILTCHNCQGAIASVTEKTEAAAKKKLKQMLSDIEESVANSEYRKILEDLRFCTQKKRLHIYHDWQLWQLLEEHGVMSKDEDINLVDLLFLDGDFYPLLAYDSTCLNYWLVPFGFSEMPDIDKEKADQIITRFDKERRSHMPVDIDIDFKQRYQPVDYQGAASIYTLLAERLLFERIMREDKAAECATSSTALIAQPAPQNIKAIQTTYNGYKFRSRLEARWAVFFDTIGVDWEYEPEGFVVNNDTCYLPDFLLHGVAGERFSGDLYVEVKGKMNDEDLQKITKFSEAGKQLLVVGNIPKGAKNSVLFRSINNAFSSSEPKNTFYSWKTIDGKTSCAMPGVDKNGKFRLFVSATGGSELTWYENDHAATENAYRKARQARFEFEDSEKK